jgi:murein DD-endopeptidase MepM/ murein hydrolase activator NlpD
LGEHSIIVITLEEAGSCGTMVRIRHSPFDYESTYCHLSEITMGEGAVRRGDMIGRIGTTGRRPGPGYEHVHLRMKDASRSDIDPEKVIVGCFDPKRPYPKEQFVETYPVPCKN